MRIKPYNPAIGYFTRASLVWLVLALLIVQIFENPGQTHQSRVGLLVMWGISVLDFFVLQSFVWVLTQKITSNEKNLKKLDLKLAFWGALKLICLGLFFLFLLEGQKLPILGLLLGAGSLTVVPLMGGFLFAGKNE